MSNKLAPCESTEEMRLALEEALALLQERHHGNPARSPGHNAQHEIKKALALLDAAAPTIPVQAAGEVGVKPLAWKRREYGYASRAKMSFGSYTVLELSIEEFCLEGVSGEKSYFNVLAEAEAAAQADYERRIRAALSTPTVDAVSWKREHDALGELIRLLDDEPSIGDAEMADALEIARSAWDHSKSPKAAPTPPAAEGDAGAVERYLRAYYHTFDATGCDPVDAILEAVAMAGRAYHHTADWSDAPEKGVSGYWSFIQDRAQAAASALASRDAAEARIAELEATARTTSEQAAEDERDRLYKAAVSGFDLSQKKGWPLASRIMQDVAKWLRAGDAMLPADRAALRAATAGQGAGR